MSHRACIEYRLWRQYEIRTCFDHFVMPPRQMSVSRTFKHLRTALTVKTNTLSQICCLHGFTQSKSIRLETPPEFLPIDRCTQYLHPTIPFLKSYSSIHGSGPIKSQNPIEADGDKKLPIAAQQMTKVDAEEICKLLSMNPSIASNSNMDSIMKNGKFEVIITPVLVLEVLKKLSNSGVLALSFFRWAEKQDGFKYTTDSYNALIDSLGKIKQFNLIWELVRSMKTKRLLTKDTFMLIIRRYARAKFVKEAVETFEKRMEEEFGLNPDPEDFNRFLDTLTKSRQVQKAQEVFDKMKGKRRFTPDNKSYAILLEGWGMKQDFLRLDEVYREMIAEGLAPDAVAYGIIMNACCKARKVDEAVARFHEMQAKNCKPTPHVFCTLINGLGAEKRLGEALKFFEMSKASGFAPEAPTYNAVVGSYCSSLRFDDAFRVVDEMKRSGIGPNSRTYDIILHHMIKAQMTKEAYSIFQRMNRSGSEPTVSTYEIIVRMFCSQGQASMAMKVWDHMKSRGILPTMHMFCTLINMLCREKRLEEAGNYFQEMLDMGIRPPGPMFSNLRQALLVGGKKEVAFALGQKLDRLRKTQILS